MPSYLVETFLARGDDFCGSSWLPQGGRPPGAAAALATTLLAFGLVLAVQPNHGGSGNQ